jgi:hypothetical protein
VTSDRTGTLTSDDTSRTGGSWAIPAASYIDLASPSVQALLADNDRTSPHAAAQHVADVLTGMFRESFWVRTWAPPVAAAFDGGDAAAVADLLGQRPATIADLWTLADRVCPTGWRVVAEFYREDDLDGSLWLRLGLSELERITALRAVERIAAAAQATTGTTYLCLPA